MKKLTDFIIEYPNVLDPELCQEIIDRFNVDDRAMPGLTFGGPVGAWKKSKDLNITHHKDWKDIDDIMFNALAPKLNEYMKKVCNDFKNYSRIDEVIDTGYQVQRTDKGEYYKWHTDFGVAGAPGEGYILYRHFTYLFYLNDNFEGGHTQFFGGDEHDIIPETGKLLMFPANPFWVHQGQEVTEGSKYVITGWVMSNIPCPPLP